MPSRSELTLGSVQSPKLCLESKYTRFKVRKRRHFRRRIVRVGNEIEDSFKETNYLIAEQGSASTLLVVFIFGDLVGGVQLEHDVLEHDDHD